MPLCAPTVVRIAVVRPGEGFGQAPAPVFAPSPVRSLSSVGIAAAGGVAPTTTTLAIRGSRTIGEACMACS